MGRSRSPSQKHKKKDKKPKKEHKRQRDASRSSEEDVRNKKSAKHHRSRSRQHVVRKKELEHRHNKSKSRSRSRDNRGSRVETEEERLRKQQKRRVLAKLMAMNFDNNSDSDDDVRRMPAQTNTETSTVPPPVVTPTPPAPQTFSAPKISKWEKGVIPQATQLKMAEIERHQKAAQMAIQALQENTKETQDKSLSLDVGCVSDEQEFLKLSEDRSIQLDKNNKEDQPTEKVTNPSMDIEEDPLDCYMKQINGGAVKQMELPKRGRENIATFEDVLMAKDTYKDESSEDQKYKDSFLSALKNFKKQQKLMPDQKGQVMDDDDNREDAEDFLLDKEEDLDFFAKQRKLAERKELNQVDHAQQIYANVNFKFYRQADQVKNMDPKEVEKYRKQAGDIKVRGRDILNPVFNWYQCGFSDKVLSVIEKREYKKPFPIQAQSFPLIMSGRDIIGIAETGSGKTLAYLLPVIRHVEDQPRVQEGQGPIAIVMAPTRQLARQVYIEAKTFCKPLGLNCLAVYGGTGVQTQLSELRRGADIVICTPGRMIDVLTLNNGKITNLRRVTMIIIDQADRMFDLGFEPQITKIINNIRPNHQTLMFSATFPKNVETLAKRILRKPVEIIVGSRGQACMNIEQIVEVREQSTKFLRLLEILGHWNDKGSILIFVDKQTEADYLFKELVQYGYYSLVLHGAMDHTDREFTIYDYKKGVRNIMIATSVCARGLDIKSIVLVINFKCPNHLEDYIHRIGRTGRAGNKGTAITFITPTEEQYSVDLLKALEMASIEPPENLKKMVQTYLSKVNKGQARKIRNRNIQGTGFKFDEEEEDQAKTIKDMIKKQIKSEGLGGFSDSDEEDIEKQKKRQEDRRGRNEQQRVAEAIKDPQTKNKLIAQAMKAVSEAIKNGVPMTTEKLLEIAVNQMKQAVSKHKIIRTVHDGIEQVSKIISQIENKNSDGNSEYFSYDFQINDYPPLARQKVLQQQFISSIQQQNNVKISVRGVFVQAGKKLPIGARKQYMHIQAENKHYVSSAYREIKRVLEETAYENLHMGGPMGRYSI